MSELRELIRKIKGDCSETCGALDIDQAISVIKSEFMKAVGKDVENTALGGADSPCYMIPITNGFLYGNERDGMVYNQAKAEIRQKIKEM